MSGESCLAAEFIDYLEGGQISWHLHNGPVFLSGIIRFCVGKGDENTMRCGVGRGCRECDLTKSQALVFGIVHAGVWYMSFIIWRRAFGLLGLFAGFWGCCVCLRIPLVVGNLVMGCWLVGFGSGWVSGG